ncbi:DUF308 domain-containing protein, partial [Acinetobacter baumannii]
MLNINREKLLSLASGDMKKQRNTLIVLAVLLLLGGIVCLLNPMASGIVVSAIVGVLLILSGVGAIVSILSSAIYTGWSRLFG